MRKLSILLVSVISVICLCFGLVACNNNNEPQKTALSVPANVKTEDDKLVWDSVDGATNGYTVKINADETTKSSGTSLDLTTVTAKLNEGANTLSVKANGTDAALESAYSATVTYTYTPKTEPGSDEPDPDEKQPLAKPTGLAVTDNTLSWTAVDGATNGYTVKINDSETITVEQGTSLDLSTVTDKLEEGDNTLYVKANATDTALESAYSDGVPYTYNPNVPHEHHLTKTDAKDPTCTEDGNKDYWTCSDCLKHFKDDQGEAEYTEEDSYVIPATGHEMDEKVEHKDATCEADGNEEYYYCTKCQKYFKDDQGAEEYENGEPVIEKLGHKSAKLIPEKEAAVDEDGNEAYWFCDDCNTYFADNGGERGDKLETQAIPTIPAIVIEKAEYYAVYIGGAGSKDLYIFGRFSDKDGKVYELDKSKLITEFTVGGTDKLSAAEVTYGSDNACVIKLTLDSALATDKPTAITYKLYKQEEAVTVNLQTHDQNFWFATSDVAENRAYGEGLDGEVKGTGIGDEYTKYFDVYAEDDISIADFADKAVTLTGMPLVSRIPVSEVGTRDELATYLAKHGLKGEYNLVIVGYQIKEDGGTTTITPINSAGVSEVMAFDISEENLKTRLVQPTVGVTTYDDRGGLNVTMPQDYLEKLAELFGLETGLEAKDLGTYVRFHVVVTLGEEQKEFYSDIVNGGLSVSTADMRFNIYNLFKDSKSSDYKVSVSLALVEDSDYAEDLRESLPRTIDWTQTLSEEDLKLSFYGAWSLEDGGNNRIDYKWEEHDGGYVEAVILNFYRVEKGEEFEYIGQEPFAVYTINDRNYVYWEQANGNNPAIKDFLKAAWVKYLKDNGITDDGAIEYENTFAVAMQRLATEDAKALGYLDSALSFAMDGEKIATKTITWTKEDLTAPTDAQFGFAQAGAITFLRKPKNGTAFTVDKAQYVEVKFTNAKDESFTAYIYALEEQETTEVEGVSTTTTVLKAYLCATQDPATETDKLSLAKATDSWCDCTLLINWINSAFEWTEAFDIRAGKVQTKIVISEDSPYIFEAENGGWSEEITYDNDCEQKEAWETWFTQQEQEKAGQDA